MSAGSCLRSIVLRSTRLSNCLTLSHNRFFSCCPPRFQQTPSPQSTALQENLYGGHSRFIAEAKRNEKWADGVDNSKRGGEEGTGEEVEDLPEGVGRLSPTSSHLFKLIIPIPTPEKSKTPLTVFLLHPSQPLSHVSRLIQASLPLERSSNTTVAFRSIPHRPTSKEVVWSDSTDVGDFVKEAAQDREFAITLSSRTPKPAPSSKQDASPSQTDSKLDETQVRILVPSFRTRTRFLRHRLKNISTELEQLEKIKRECDHIAHQSARRLALGGFAMLLVYFGVVTRLTFWDLGWDIMEPVTHLSGLTWIIASYMWFLYQGREVSYSALLKQSVSTRRAKLYESKGLDIDQWADLVSEEKQLRREIYKIADDYDIKWDGTPDGKFAVPDAVNTTLSKQKSTEKGERPMTPSERMEKQREYDKKADLKRDDGKQDEK